MVYISLTLFAAFLTINRFILFSFIRVRHNRTGKSWTAVEKLLYTKSLLEPFENKGRRREVKYDFEEDVGTK